MNQITMPETKEGEVYGGAIIHPDGTGHHFIVLPGDKDDIKFDDAVTWAKELGGDLPNCVEQALLFDQNKDLFHERAYWSNTQHASVSHYAWYQGFSRGGQSTSLKSAELRARAVRREPI